MAITLVFYLIDEYERIYSAYGLSFRVFVEEVEVLVEVLPLCKKFIVLLLCKLSVR